MAQAPLPIDYNLKYILKLNIEGESIIFKVSNDGEFDTLSYMNKMTLNEIKQINSLFQGINSLKNFADYIENLDKENKLNYKKNNDSLSITFNYEYFLSKVPIEIKLLPTINYLFESKIKNIEDQLNDYKNKQVIKTDNIKKLVKIDINKQNEQINQLKEQNKQLINEINLIKQIIGDDQRLTKKHVEEFNSKKDEKEMNINNQKEIQKQLKEIKNQLEELQKRINNQEEKRKEFVEEMIKQEAIKNKRIEEINKRIEEGENKIKEREKEIRKKLDDMNRIEEYLKSMKQNEENKVLNEEENKRKKEEENKRKKEEENKRKKEEELNIYKGLNKEEVEDLLSELNQEYNVLTIIDEKQLRAKIVELKCDRGALADWIVNNL